MTLRIAGQLGRPSEDRQRSMRRVARRGRCRRERAHAGHDGRRGASQSSVRERPRSAASAGAAELSPQPDAGDQLIARFASAPAALAPRPSRPTCVPRCSTTLERIAIVSFMGSTPWLARARERIEARPQASVGPGGGAAGPTSWRGGGSLAGVRGAATRHWTSMPWPTCRLSISSRSGSPSAFRAARGPPARGPGEGLSEHVSRADDRSPTLATLLSSPAIAPRTMPQLRRSAKQ